MLVNRCSPPPPLILSGGVVPLTETETLERWCRFSNQSQFFPPTGFFFEILNWES